MPSKTRKFERDFTMHLRLESDGTTSVKWDPSVATPQSDALKGYVNMTLRFADEMGGVDNAYRAMQALVHERRVLQNHAFVSKQNATPSIGSVGAESEPTVSVLLPPSIREDCVYTDEAPDLTEYGKQLVEEYDRDNPTG